MSPSRTVTFVDVLQTAFGRLAHHAAPDGAAPLLALAGNREELRRRIVASLASAHDGAMARMLHRIWIASFWILLHDLWTLAPKPRPASPAEEGTTRHASSGPAKALRRAVVRARMAEDSTTPLRWVDVDREAADGRGSAPDAEADLGAALIRACIADAEQAPTRAVVSAAVSNGWRNILGQD